MVEKQHLDYLDFWICLILCAWNKKILDIQLGLAVLWARWPFWILWRCNFNLLESGWAPCSRHLAHERRNRVIIGRLDPSQQDWPVSLIENCKLPWCFADLCHPKCISLKDEYQNNHLHGLIWACSQSSTTRRSSAIKMANAEGPFLSNSVWVTRSFLEAVHMESCMEPQWFTLRGPTWHTKHFVRLSHHRRNQPLLSFMNAHIDTLILKLHWKIASWCFSL